jgi:tetratricopeptide (TPR) repeat protein
MADEDDDVSRVHMGDPAAVGLAMNAPSAAAGEAQAYLREQTELARLQKQNLLEQNAFELSHLRFRRFADWGKFALQVGVGLILLLIVLALGAMVWDAARGRDLVVEAFSVPPDVAQSGMTGKVLASRVLDRFGQMQADTIGTIQGSGSYRRDTGEEVRVEIPDTGVSLGEMDRYLRAWLGHETHVAGDLVRTPKGFALTIRYGAEPGITEEDGDLGKLIEKSAEHVYAASRPYRFVEYLIGKQRFAEALALVPELAARGTPQDRARAFAAWGEISFRQGDMVDAAAKNSQAARLDPDNPLVLAWLASAEGNLGHDEASRANADATIRAWHGEEVAALDADEAAMLPILFAAYRDDVNGDIPGALGAWHRLSVSGWGGYDRAGHAIDSAADHDFAQARATAESIPAKDRFGLPSTARPLVQFMIAWLAGDWPQAVREGRNTDAIMTARPGLVWNQRVNVWPQLAYAMARAGDRAGADKLIAQTTADCDNCLRMRGRIAALEGDWAGAARDFAAVAARSPHTPYAETDWGAGLLAKGDLDGAIAKFDAAHAKSPHFADPLEMWGEALIAKNRSDLALAKFEEAGKYAPNWARLHLKWGEALFWLGKKDEAQQQFAIAAHLDLSPAEASQLGKMQRHV